VSEVGGGGVDLVVRAATDEDEPVMAELVRGAMGWPADAPLAEYLRWKHHQNPFGRSPAWVAVDDGAIVGLRTLLRWEFEVPTGPPLRAVRAVDTATAASHRGQGVFTRLTLHGVEACRADGCDLVFNTPNDKSRPGYLKMGWRVVGRLPVAFRPCRASGLPALARAGVPAERFSTPTTAGEAASDALGDATALDELLDAQPPPSGVRTRRSVAYLRWRYDGFSPLHYRVIVAPGGVRRGLAVFRLRQRGRALEAAVVEVLAVDGPTRRALLRDLVRACGADYALLIAAPASVVGAGFAPLPRRGPILTCRPLQGDGPSTVGGWGLSLGDVELF
jgi:GNAT superfamily N-acetyltransferase